MEHSHHPGEIRARLAEGPKTSYLSDWVYGRIDGAITTFAIVAGVVGAEMSTRVILILGAANIIADGFSMAASNYSGTKAELDDYRRHRAYEEEQVERIPEAERMEVREIYRAKGFEGQELERIVEVITADKGRWVDTMMVRNTVYRPRLAIPSRRVCARSRRLSCAAWRPSSPSSYRSTMRSKQPSFLPVLFSSLSAQSRPSGRPRPGGGPARKRWRSA